MKVLLVGLTFAAAVLGGSIGYVSLKTGTNPAEYLSEYGLSEDGLRQVIGREANAPNREGERVDGQSAAGEVIRSVESEADIDTGTGSDIKAETRAEAGPEDIVISEAELNAMVTDAIASQPYTAPILDIAKGVNTQLENDRIESGMTINLGEIPRDDLPVEAKDAIDQLIGTFPFLADRDVYLGIEGSPKVVNGAISLENANIKLGPLSLPASGVASELGISQVDIERQLNAVLAQQGLTPEDVRVVDGQIIITGLL